MGQDTARPQGRRRRRLGVAFAAALVGSMMVVGPGRAEAAPTGDGPVLTSVTPTNSPLLGGGNEVQFHGSGFSTAPGGTTFLIGPLDPCESPCVAFQSVACPSDVLCFGIAPPLPPMQGEGGDCTAITGIAVVVDGQQDVLGEDFTWGNCPPPGPDDLADTGTGSSLVLGLIATSALLVGVALLKLTRRRYA
jgi:hypothetical protein